SKATGKYNIELAEWERTANDEKTFRNFCPFFQKQWAKKNSKNETNSKLASYGIANSAQEKIHQQTQSKQEILAKFLALIQGDSDKKMENYEGYRVNNHCDRQGSQSSHHKGQQDKQLQA
ncbi:hypothetical protein ACHAW6_004001, partial [Cyclotella cf. meneghiniana]